MSGWLTGARCVALALAILICAAPIAHTLYHGPAAMVAEAEHLAQHHHHADAHDAKGHHNSGDHEHVVTDIIMTAGAELYMPPHCKIRTACDIATGMLLDKLRRPPKTQLA